MFDISWGELAVLSGVGLVLVGRKDLPMASRAVGQQVGRIVGLLQGARLRADRYASDHQLKQLQNEFRSGLRELDAVKAELAGSMMPHHGSSRVVGNMHNLGAMVSGVDRKRVAATTTTTTTSMGMDSRISPSTNYPYATVTDAIPSPLQSSSTTATSMGAEYLAAAQQAEQNLQGTNYSDSSPITFTSLAPRSQSVAAVAEEEWEKRGIGFRSVAESGGGRGRDSFMSSQVQRRIDGGNNIGGSINAGGGGAMILSNYLRQSLIYDQYERTIREQDDMLRSRVEKVREERTTTQTSTSNNNGNGG